MTSREHRYYLTCGILGCSRSAQYKLTNVDRRQIASDYFCATHVELKTHKYLIQRHSVQLVDLWEEHERFFTDPDFVKPSTEPLDDRVRNLVEAQQATKEVNDLIINMFSRLAERVDSLEAKKNSNTDTAMFHIEGLQRTVDGLEQSITSFEEFRKNVQWQIDSLYVKYDRIVRNLQSITDSPN